MARAKRLTAEQVALAHRLHAHGCGRLEIARQVAGSADYLRVILRGDVTPAAKPLGWEPRPGRLQLTDREEIVIGLARGENFSDVARRIGKDPSTVSREVGANGGRVAYRAWPAHCRARERAKRPKPAKLDCPRLAAQVTEWLEELWSPEEIARRLRIEHPDDPMMWVSHETVYQSLYVQGKGELRRELARCLRTGRARRRPRGAPDRADTRISGLVSISERPAEVADRAVPGHWEGDLIIGKDNASAVGTLVERMTRFLMLLHLPDGYDAASVEAAMRAAITTLPAALTRSITWDRGIEMARHLDFTLATGIPVYFCDPHSPWQRGSNENTNGLLRQYMPKGTDLSVHTATDLARISDSLNGRPRMTLNWMTPSEKLAEVLLR